MSDTLKRLEIITGGCREPIPPRFYRTFEDRLFDACVYCRAPLLTADGYYTILKLYFEGELREEIAVCRKCQAELKQGYSSESLNALKAIYSEDYVRRRLEILFETGADEDRVGRMLARCAVCAAPGGEALTRVEYALCQGGELVFYTQPSMVCEPCTLRIYNSLSEQTRGHKRRFAQEHFGFPPPGSDLEEAVSKNAHLWLLG